MKKFKHHSYFAKPDLAQQYRFPYVCLGCRKSFKKPKRDLPRPCPQCTQPMTMLDRKFAAPRTAALEQWHKVEYLVRHGFRFQSLHEPDGSLVAYPASLAEAKVFVEDHAQKLRFR